MWVIIYIKDNVTKVWDLQVDSRERALNIGHELTRDYLADFFKVRKLT